MLYFWEVSNKNNRSTFWYCIVISIVIGFIVWGILTRQYGLSFIVLLSFGVFFFIENNSKENINIQIFEKGINIQDLFYDYKNIISFCFVYSGKQAIYLRLNTNIGNLKKIDLDINDKIQKDLQGILINFIEKKDDQELEIADKFFKILNF